LVCQEGFGKNRCEYSGLDASIANAAFACVAGQFDMPN
jgi:hypothetical protein